MRQAVQERADGVRLREHVADARFVAGQASLLAEGEGESTDLVREVLATGLATT